MRWSIGRSNTCDWLVGKAICRVFASRFPRVALRSPINGSKESETVGDLNKHAKGPLAKQSWRAAGHRLNSPVIKRRSCGYRATRKCISRHVNRGLNGPGLAFYCYYDARKLQNAHSTTTRAVRRLRAHIHTNVFDFFFDY